MSLNQLIDTTNVENRKYLNCKFNSINTPVIKLNNNPGTSGQFIKNVGGEAIWADDTPVVVPGPPNSILTTESDGITIDWSNDAKLNNVDIDVSLSFNGSAGTNGQVVVNNAGTPEWATLTTPLIPHGTAFQLLQTNSAGNAAQWTSDIQPRDVNITRNLLMNGLTAAAGVPLVRDVVNQKWGLMGANFVNPGPNNSILVTAPNGSASQWANDIVVDNIGINGTITFPDGAGVAGQFVKNDGTGGIWDNITDADITPGLANQVLTTNSTGDTTKWSSTISVDGDLVFDGIYGSPGQFVKKKSGGQLWSNITTGDVTPGSANQVFITNASGSSVWSSNIVVGDAKVNTSFTLNGVTGADGMYIRSYAPQPKWSYLLAPDIYPGSANNVIATNSTGDAVGWTDDLVLNSVTFDADINQTALNYYSESISIPNTFTLEDGGVATINLTYQRIGNKVSIHVPSLSSSAFVFGAQPPYRVSTAIPSIYRPTYGSGAVTTPTSNYHSELLQCSQLSGTGCAGVGFIGSNGVITIYTNVNLNVTAGLNTLVSYAHTFNFLID